MKKCLIVHAVCVLQIIKFAYSKLAISLYLLFSICLSKKKMLWIFSKKRVFYVLKECQNAHKIQLCVSKKPLLAIIAEQLQ